MKKAYSKSLILIALLLSAVVGKSQYAKYENETGWSLGGNIGGTYQHPGKTSEITPYGGIAGGFTLGKEWRKKDAFFAPGLRFRYLRGVTFGQDSNRSDSLNLASVDRFNGNSSAELDYLNNGGVILHNYRNDLNDFSLEGVITLNRLRERTGIILAGFAGIGLTGYETRTDQLQNFPFGSGRYNYESSEYDEVNARELIYDRDLGDWESYADGNDGIEIGFMPHIGFEVGFQFSPVFSMGFVHRHTFTLTNTFDGMQYDATGANTNINDRYNYTAFKMRFRLGGSTSHDHNEDINDYTDNDPVDSNNNNTVVVNPPPPPKPRVDIIDPYNSPYETTNSQFTIKANIYHINGPGNITFKQNGVKNVNFSYTSSNNNFSAPVILKPGSNVFELRATNNAGTDYETRVIIYKGENNVSAMPPIVTISNPGQSPYTVTNNVFNVSSSVFNVNGKQDITFKVNNQVKTNFNFNNTSKVLTSTIYLNPGFNIISVKGVNSAGSDIKTATIIYEEPETSIPHPPVVNIINPSMNPTTVNSSNFTLDASVTNVSTKNNITLKVNGATTTNFTFNPSTSMLSINRNLVEGANVFEISAFNNDGSDYASTTIIYSKPDVPKPPIVDITSPNPNPHTVYTNTSSITASVLNVNSKNDITLKINGINTSNFSYSTSSKQLFVTASLNQGANVFDITAVNQDGSDHASTTIIYIKEDPQLPPQVTFTNPAVSPANVSNTPYYITAVALHVDSYSGINVKLNGNSISNFNFNTSTKQVSFSAPLILGNNTVQITGSNSAGSDTETATINYTKAVEPPIVTITNPGSNPHTTSNPAGNVQASIQNINSASDIDLMINGVNTNTFTFNAATGVMNINKTLVQGGNVFAISASNSAGSDSKTTTIIYEPVECDDPTISLIQPNISPLNHIATNNTFTVQASVQNLSSNQGLVFKVNGVVKTNFSFNTSTGQFNSTVNLQDGSNSIELIANNDCGNASINSTILFGYENEPCDVPVVTITDPTADPLKTEATTYEVKATVTNVSSANQIIFMNNGMAKSNFTFDPATHNLTSNQTLTMGKNKIVIKATNDCGEGTGRTDIEREVCNDPVISFTKPTVNTTNNSSIQFAANISHSSSSNVTVELNGQQVNFLMRGNVLTTNQNLSVGNNTLTITASNECGTVSQSFTIERESCDIPQLSAVNPSSSGQNATTANFNFAAAAQFVDSKSQLQVNHNGSTSIPFNFNAATGAITASVTLDNGTNQFTVVASNDCGDDELEVTIEYNPVVEDEDCEEPTVSLQSPAASGSYNLVQNDQQSVVFTTQNITSGNQVQFQVNGGSTPFNFNANQNKISAQVALDLGMNTVSVIVTNDCGQDAANLNLRYVGSDQSGDETNTQVDTTSNSGNNNGGENDGNGNNGSSGITNGGQPPMIQMINPTTSGEQVSTPSIIIRGTVDNISSDNQLSIKVNGNNNPGFSFDNAQGLFTLSIALNAGNNSISITANNNSGTDSEDLLIAYVPAGSGATNNGGSSNNSSGRDPGNGNDEEDEEEDSTKSGKVENGNTNGKENANLEIERKQREEAERKAKEETRKKAQEEARRKAQEEARKKAQEEARRKAQEEARKKAQEEARRKAQEEARKKAQEEARRKAQEEARKKAQEEARRKAQEEARKKAQEEARRKAQEEARKKAQEEARRKAQEEARKKAQEEARRKAQEEARKKAQEEARRKAQEEARKKAQEEARRKAREEARKKAQEEARRKAEEEKKKKEEEEEKIKIEKKKRQPTRRGGGGGR